MRGKVEIGECQDATAGQTPVMCLQVQRLKDGDQRAKSNSITSVDFETAISKSGWGKFNLGILLLAIPAACTSGSVSGSMSYVIPAATVDLNLTPTSKALLQSACYAGMISSGFLWGFLSDTFGRKKLIVVGFLLDFLMNFLTGVFTSVPLMLLFKYLSGFMVCGPFSIFSAYISEVFLSKRRDIAVLSAGIFSALGNIAQAGLAMWIIPSEVPFHLPLKSWQLFHILCGIPSLICGVGSIFCVESPKFLVEQGNHDKALEVCRTIYTINTGNPPNTYPVKKLQHQITKTKKTFWGTIVESVTIFKPPYIQRGALSFLIHFGVVASMNTLRLWLPEILMLVNVSEMDHKLGLCPILAEGNIARSNSTLSISGNASQVYAEMMLVNAASMVGHLIFMLVVNYLGKKKILILCSLLSGACVTIIPFISADYVFIPASIFTSLNNVSFYSNIAIVVGIFPTKLRATSVCMTMLMGRISILIINFLIVSLIYSYCLQFFYFLGVLSIVIATLAFFLSMEPISSVPATPTKQNTS